MTNGEQPRSDPQDFAEIARNKGRRQRRWGTALLVLGILVQVIGGAIIVAFVSQESSLDIGMNLGAVGSLLTIAGVGTLISAPQERVASLTMRVVSVIVLVVVVVVLFFVQMLLFFYYGLSHSKDP